MKNQRNPSIILACIIVAGLLFRLPASAQVDLSILNAAGTSSTISVQAGQSFNAQVYVSGLTSSQPLDSFDLTFAPLPSGLTLTSVTPIVPSGWVSLGTGQPAGAANFSGSDITGNAELALASFQTSSNLSAGLYTLTLTAPGPFQDLTTTTPPPGAISYTLFSASVAVSSVPEPSSLVLFLSGAGFLTLFALHRRTWSVLCESRI